MAEYQIFDLILKTATFIFVVLAYSNNQKK